MEQMSANSVVVQLINGFLFGAGFGLALALLTALSVNMGF